MATDLAIRPDPEVWSLVPVLEEANPWLEARLEGVPDERRQRTLDAALLALRARVESDAVFVLLLDAAEGAVLSTLTVLGYGDLPPVADAADAERIAHAAIGSTWESDVIDVELGSMRGWRVTVLDADPAGRDGAGEQVTVAALVWSVYVVDVAGAVVIAILSPLSPEHAFIAQHHSEQLLATLEAGR